MNFTDIEKIDAFDRIVGNYYDKNFGTMAKADLELLLFSIYLDHYDKNNKRYSDYSLSKELGITQTRIRSLRERRELKYRNESGDGRWWKDRFASLVQNAKIDEKKYVKVLIPDVEVLIELRYFLEEHQLFDDYQLNPKVFQCRIDVFLEIVRKMGSESDIVFDTQSREKLKEIEKNCEDADKGFIRTILENGFKEGMEEIVKNGSLSILKSVLKCVPFGGFSQMVIDALLG